MSEFEPGFIDANTWTAFDADPIAGQNPRRRFAVVTSSSSPDMALLDVLAERISAHRVAKLIKARDLRWALAFDDGNTKFVVIECLGRLDDINAVAGELRQMGYAELAHYDRPEAFRVRHLHLPESQSGLAPGGVSSNS